MLRQPEVNSRYLERWEMSEKDEKLTEAALLADYIKSKKSLELLKADAERLAKTFVGLANMLNPDKIWNMSLESYEPYLSAETFEKIKKLKSAIDIGTNEVNNLRSRVDNAGLGSELK